MLVILLGYLLVMVYICCHCFIFGKLDVEPLCVLIFAKASWFVGKLVMNWQRIGHLYISNHAVQCYELVCRKNETILIRYQTLKDPSLNLLH